VVSRYHRGQLNALGSHTVLKEALSDTILFFNAFCPYNLRQGT